MTELTSLRSLAAVTALDAQTVLAGNRPGASLQLDKTYFSGQLRALERFDASTDPIQNRDERVQTLEDSWNAYGRIDVEVDTLTADALWNSSTRFWHQVRQIPEVEHLRNAFPGRCFVVPEWLKTGNRLHYGARVYFFRSDDGPEPDAVLQQNIDAVVDGPFETFERYQGQLHGYPDCCIDFYHERSADAPSPEWRSVEPFRDRIATDALEAGPSGSIDDALPAFSECDGCAAFFAREFFPEPGCDTALATGEAICDALSSPFPTRLVEDSVRLTLGYNYLVARAVHTGDSQRPTPGALGREHLMFYLPVDELAGMPRYS
jgi:hypothetical protein